MPTPISIPELEDEYTRQLMEHVALGEEAREFRNGKLFKYICDEAETKVKDAQKKLSRVNPSNTTEIIKLQAIIVQFEHFTQTLEKILINGDSAYQFYLQSLELTEQ